MPPDDAVNRMSSTTELPVTSRSASFGPDRPRSWATSAQRKMARLYIYTNLSLKEILNSLHISLEPERDEKTTLQKERLQGLGKDLRWVKSRQEGNIRSSAARDDLIQSTIDVEATATLGSTKNPCQLGGFSHFRRTRRPHEIIEGCLEYVAAGGCAYVLNDYEAHRKREEILWHSGRSEIQASDIPEKGN
ncbi:hypothetical protein HJFPF1_12233 [Paramyrothecium foliicola]|nr:hypothetical protein HJFPF1_12233 [Paramyrothecium foliicola]